MGNKRQEMVWRQVRPCPDMSRHRKEIEKQTYSTLYVILATVYKFSPTLHAWLDFRGYFRYAFLLRANVPLLLVGLSFFFKSQIFELAV